MEELKKNIWRIWKIGKLIKKTRKKNLFENWECEKSFMKTK